MVGREGDYWTEYSNIPNIGLNGNNVLTETKNSEIAY